jgi:hypothetical protein
MQPVRIFAVPVKPPPAPLPPVAAAEASLIIDVPLEHRVPGWDRSEPMPPDGKLWKDKERTEPNRAYDEQGAFDTEYFIEMRKRQAILEADLIYQFVVDVAGLAGQGVSADDFWRAKETGGRAVETVFRNLDLSRAALEGISGNMRDDVKNEAHRVFKTNERVSDEKRIVEAFTNEASKRAARQAIAASQLKATYDLKGITLPPEFTTLLAAESAGGVPASGPDVNEYHQLRNATPGFTVAAYEQQERDRLKRDEAAGKALDSTSQPEQVTARGRRIQALNEELTKRIERLRRAEALANGVTSAGVAPLPSEASVRLTDGTYLGEEINDPKLMLIKLMFRPAHVINQAELDAWDRVYYDGKYKQLVKNDTDPRAVRDRLELARTIDRLLRTSDPGVSWRQTPTNIGILFLTPQFRSALKMAHDRLRNVCHKHWVPLEDLMTHREVEMYFAQLVAYQIARNASLFPGRFLSVSITKMVADDEQRLFAMFRSLQCDANGFLCFAQGDEPADRDERRATEANRRQYVRATGRYFADRYVDDDDVNTKRLRITKKPIFGVVAAAKKDADRRALASIL